MKSKRLQTAAIIAEIVSAIAIVVSLVFVGYELRQSSAISSRDVELILFERGRESNRMVIENEMLASTIIRFENGAQDLTAIDSLWYRLYQDDFFNSWEIAWSYHADLILTDQAWDEWDEWYQAEASKLPTFAWTSNRHNFTGVEFRDHVDRVMFKD